MKYAACTFNDNPGAKTYDYAIPEGLDLKEGDVVRVPNKDGWKKVHVQETKDETDCPAEWIKTIIGIHEEEDSDEAEI